MGHHGNSFLSFGVAPVGEVGGWVELARTTLGSPADTVTVSSIPDKRYYMVLFNELNTGSIGTRLQIGNTTIDTGTNYAYRVSTDGASDTTAINTTRLISGSFGSGGASPAFNLLWMANLSAKEKLVIGHSVLRQTAGAGTAPARKESVDKWVNTSSVPDIFTWTNTDTGSFGTGAEAIILGWDPTDTHTSNFWEPLADVDLSTGESDVIDSGTITAKKYLWVQLFNAGNSAGEEQLTFNSDTGTNYARRLSANGASDSTNVSQAFIENMFTGGTATNESLGNGFIINNSANEKLLFTHVVVNNTAGAGNAPGRLESACKWDNTASQITKLTFTSTAGVFAKNSFLKVWGSN